MRRVADITPMGARWWYSFNDWRVKNGPFYLIFSYSTFASLRIGMSGSASFQSARKF